VQSFKEPLLPCRQLTQLSSELAALTDLAAAPVFARRIADAGCGLVRAGAGGPWVANLLSALNDQLTAAVIDLTAHRHRLPPVAWCWLALGSEGRQEQGFVTDQDNGLVFAASDAQEAGALRALFLPFAHEVNRHLADCGFALCSGGIMAGNADWCLSLDEWRERFIEWVRRPEPTALLNASIFFDLRPLHGALDLGANLRRLLLSLTVDTPSFLHLMAANAQHAVVPLNFRGELAGDEHGELDLKKFGSRIFVDCARILALAAGVPAVATIDRLAEAGTVGGMQPDEVAAATTAFSFILRLRQEQQIAADALGAAAGNGLKPDSLNDVDRAILRESLKQARRLQQRLKLNYAL
jgi:CBS domain-containing protein